MKQRIMLCAALTGLALAGLLVARALQNNAPRTADTGPSTASLIEHATPAAEESSNASSSTPSGLEAFKNIPSEAGALDSLLDSLSR